MQIKMNKEVQAQELMKYMETLELTEEEKEKVFHLNAEKYILNK